MLMTLKFVYYFFLLQAQGGSQNQNLINLFLNEAFSNYVIFLAGMIFGIIGWLIVNFLSRRNRKL